jgi:hypothetical protein
VTKLKWNFNCKLQKAKPAKNKGEEKLQKAAFPLPLSIFSSFSRIPLIIYSPILGPASPPRLKKNSVSFFNLITGYLQKFKLAFIKTKKRIPTFCKVGDSFIS